MRILHVINHFGINSGAARLVASLIPCQIELGHQVDLISLSEESPSYVEAMGKIGCHCHTLLGKCDDPKRKPQLIFKLIPFMKSYDIVHVHLFPSLYWVAIAKMLSRAKCMLVVTEHSTLNNRQGKTWIKPFERFIYRQYDAVIAITDAVKENLHRFVDAHLAVDVILNGIDLASFREAKAVSRDSLDIPEGVILVTQVAGFRPPKDQLTVLRALKRLPCNVHLMFVGTGSTLEDHMRKTQEMGLSGSVHFVGLRQDVPALVKTSDIVVMSSHFEGFGLAAVEGMAAGKPVIGSDVPGLLEVIQGAGIVFPVHDDKILAEEILRLSKDRDYREDVTKKCSIRAGDYDIWIMAKKYDEVYRGLM